MTADDDGGPAWKKVDPLPGAGALKSEVMT